MSDVEMIWAAHTTEGVAMNESAYCVKHFDNHYDEAVVEDAEDWDGQPARLVVRHDDLTCQQCKAEAYVERAIAEDIRAALDDNESSENVTGDAHVTIDGIPDEVNATIAAIRETYPTATCFEVSSSDQGRYGYWLYAVKFDDDTVIDGDSGTFAELAEQVQDQWLADLSWGAFGDTNADSGFDVDMATGRILRAWTFVGHWESDEIVVEYILPGKQDDEREDTGYWDQGLFAAAATGTTQDEALAKVRAEYETTEEN